MKNNTFFELMPLIAFFGVYYFTKNIYTATLVCIIASWLQVILYKILYKKVDKKTWLSTLLITIFGGLTIFFQNKTFVMLKPTVLYWIVAIGMFIAAQMGKNGIKILLNQQFPLPDKTWQQLNRLWIIFLIVMGGVNLLVAFNFSEAVWVSFKVFGTMIATLILTIITGIIVYQQTKHRINSN